ncbi:MAG TPA: hypothetical protein ENI16_00770, partial [Candidatus Portnoybacteria bacterium]|nr:hypothetical protein [Candidatus Portnoybacteria bacterium]
ATYNISSDTELKLVDLMKDWLPYWFKFRGGQGGILKVDFTGKGSTANFRVPYIIIKKNGQKLVKFMELKNQTGTVYIPDFGSQINSVIMIPSNQYKTTGFNSNQPSTYFSFIASTVTLSIPLITDVSPPEGSLDGGTTVTINGANFLEGAKVTFGGLEASGVRVVNSSTITAVTPAHSNGLVEVVVTNPDTQEGRLVNGFNYEGVLTDGSLLRAIGDYKVYIIKGGYKRWIQSPRVFDFYGHLNWDRIITVTPEVRDSYQDAWLIRAAGDPRVYEINGDGTKHWLNMTSEQFTTTGRIWEMVYIINSAERDFYLTGSDVIFL